MSNPFYDYITSSAISLTMAGNTGISPFLTLLLLGLVEIANPELLHMGPAMETLLTSWWSIGILGVLSLGEIIGKCIPALDEAIDSVEVFIVPVLSVLASIATLGLLPGSDTPPDVDVVALIEGPGGYRLLQDDDTANTFGEGFITFTKVCLVVGGVVLALSIHFFKMIVRVSSIGCTAGCCQPCITITEIAMVVVGVILAVVVPLFAVFAALFLLFAAGYAIRSKCCKPQKDNDDEPQDKNMDTKDDIEKQQEHRPSTQPTPSAPTDESKTTGVETFREAEFINIPLDRKPDLEATTY